MNIRTIQNKLNARLKLSAAEGFKLNFGTYRCSGSTGGCILAALSHEEYKPGVDYYDRIAADLGVTVAQAELIEAGYHDWEFLKGQHLDLSDPFYLYGQKIRKQVLSEEKGNTEEAQIS